MSGIFRYSSAWYTIKTNCIKLQTIDSEYQFAIFKPLNYCFKETIGFDVKASLAGGPLLRLIRYNKPCQIKKKF